MQIVAIGISSYVHKRSQGHTPYPKISLWNTNSCCEVAEATTDARSTELHSESPPHTNKPIRLLLLSFRSTFLRKNDDDKRSTASKTAIDCPPENVVEARPAWPDRHSRRCQRLGSRNLFLIGTSTKKSDCKEALLHVRCNG